MPERFEIYIVHKRRYIFVLFLSFSFSQKKAFGLSDGELFRPANIDQGERLLPSYLNNLLINPMFLF